MDEEIKLPEVPEELQEETVEPTIPETTGDESVEEQEVETQPEANKGAAARIKELNREKKAALEENKSLAQRLAEITAPSGTPTPGTYTPQVKDGEEITPERYQGDVNKTAEALVDIKIKQNNAVNRINNESLDAVRKYPQLDPENEQFDPELSETVTEAVEAHVRVNPYSASVTKFVDRLMKPYQSSVQREVGKQREVISRQVSDSALRPNQVRQPEKPATEKSLAELEAELGTVVT